MVIMVDKQRISRRTYITEDGYLRIPIGGDEYLLMITDEMMNVLKKYGGM